MRTRFLGLLLGLSGLAVLAGGDARAQDAKADKPEAGQAKAVEAKPAGAVPPIQAEVPFVIRGAQGEVRIVQGVPAAPVPMMRMLPAMQLNGASGMLLHLGNVVLAKFDDGPKGAQLVALVEQTRKETQKVQVTAFRQEVRTRKVQVTGADGKTTEEEQQYTIAVPFTQDIDREVQVPVGKKPTAFPFDSLRIYRLDGSKVTVAEAKTLLEKTSPVFLLRGYIGDIQPVEGAALQALNPNCLIVATDPTPDEQGAAPILPPELRFRAPALPAVPK